MLIHATCKKCKESGYIDIGSLTIEDAKSVLSKGTSSCNFGTPHEEVIPAIELFDIDWDRKVDEVPATDEMFLDELRFKFGEVYTKEQLEEKYTIESFAYGACLCSEKDTERMVLFNFSVSPSGTRFYFKVG